MTPLAVDPAALDNAGTEVVTAGEGLGSVISTLTSALSGCSGMAGDDPAGASLGHSYDNSASQLVKAMAATRNGLCSLGYGVRMSAHNYSLAEAQSNISGHGNPLSTPPMTGPISAGAPPSSVGASDGPPAGWGWVAPFIGMIWPTGDSGKLRAAAAAWSTAGTQFGMAEIVGTGRPMGAIRAQQIPEGPAIDRAFSDAYTSTTGIVQQCQKIAAQLDSYAAKIDKVHAAILDLLSRICDPMTGIKEVWEFLTDEDEDEIKKIADDIRTVVDNFASEVNALKGEIAAIVGEAETIATTMGDYVSKQWDQFLHGTDIGRAINQVGQYAKGIWGEAADFVVGIWDISSPRMLIDPEGYFKDMAGMAEGAAPLVGLGPDGSPSVLDSWKALGKNVSHWDEWQTNPASALGKSVFDVGTLFIPGGPLSKLPKTTRAALDALKDLKKPPIPKLDLPTVKPPESGPRPPESGPKPPEPGPKPPEPGRPAPAPPPKPGSAPDGAPTPHSPTESKPPVGRAPHGGGPKPIAAPPESEPKPTVSAPAEPAAAPHQQPHEPAPERVPATVPAATAPAASAPSLPAASAPSLPEPPSLPAAPTGGLPGEMPPEGGGAPHGGEPDGPPSGPPHPPDGTPSGPGDGGPHGPGDGDPGHPADGKDPHDPDDGHPPADSPPPDGDPGRPEFTLNNPLDHMSKELLALSEQHLTGSGETVLGPFKPRTGGPSYIEVALQHGASYFDIGDAWSACTPTERLAANQHVLDVAIANGDKITLSVPLGKIDPNSFTGAEIRYLESHGYHRLGDNTLIPLSKGVPR